MISRHHPIAPMSPMAHFWLSADLGYWLKDGLINGVDSKTRAFKANPSAFDFKNAEYPIGLPNDFLSLCLKPYGAGKATTKIGNRNEPSSISHIAAENLECGPFILGATTSSRLLKAIIMGVIDK